MERSPRALGRRLLESRFSPLSTIVRVRTDRPVAALTFDDGPDPRFTPRLLEILERHGAGATFFMIGRRAELHPGVVARVARAGHTVANHTFTHRSLPGLPGGARRREIREGRAALAPYGSRLFRPPKGHQSPGSLLDVALCGHAAVGWSLAGEDWGEEPADRIARRLIRDMRPGSVALLHDGLWDPATEGAADRTPTLEAVDALLEETGEAIRYVTLEELLETGTPVREPWFREPGADAGCGGGATGPDDGSVARGT